MDFLGFKCSVFQFAWPVSVNKDPGPGLQGGSLALEDGVLCWPLGRFNLEPAAISFQG